MAAAARSIVVAFFLAGAALPPSACHQPTSTVFTELGEARRLAADLRAEFHKASDASDRAVMADTDEASIAFAHEAEEASKAVQDDVAEIGPHLHSLARPAELAAFDAFTKHLEDYLALDHSVLGLAVENTNLKAQRLSFGPAREAAEALGDALRSLAAGAAPKESCRVEPLVDKALLAVREIEVLQAPHIAEADDAAMTRIEAEMSHLEAEARDSLKALSALVDAKARPGIAAATAALDRFKDVSAQIVALSRRNTNVRSLALSLREKPVLSSACDDSLRQLEDALAKEGFPATR